MAHCGVKSGFEYYSGNWNVGAAFQPREGISLATLIAAGKPLPQRKFEKSLTLSA